LIEESLPKLTVKTKVRGPWPHDYVSELDVTPAPDPARAQYYQSQIGVLLWIIELGRIDIVTEVSKLASCMILPREGHLEAVFHAYAYLKSKHNSRMAFDPCYPVIDLNKFRTDANWVEFYGEMEEPIPLDAPKVRGKTTYMRLFCDAYFAGDKRLEDSEKATSYISTTLRYLGYRKNKRPLVETIVFGAEFVTKKIGTEAVISIRFKLRMMGVDLVGPRFVQGDNMSVVHNTSNPASTLKRNPMPSATNLCEKPPRWGSSW
jgi:hypothetical protein